MEAGYHSDPDVHRHKWHLIENYQQPASNLPEQRHRFHAVSSPLMNLKYLYARLGPRLEDLSPPAESTTSQSGLMLRSAPVLKPLIKSPSRLSLIDTCERPEGEPGKGHRVYQSWETFRPKPHDKHGGIRPTGPLEVIHVLAATTVNEPVNTSTPTSSEYQDATSRWSFIPITALA